MIAPTSTTPATDVTNVASQLRLAVTRTSRRLRQEAGEGLTPSQGAALATVYRHGPLTPSELAHREQVKRPTATRIIGSLEEAGLVARTPDPTDGRSALIALTPKGRDLIKRLRTRKTAYLAQRIRDLPGEEIATLERAAGILERLLEEERA
jgi:DNA-binding MarR family transcriptional regulator